MTASTGNTARLALVVFLFAVAATAFADDPNVVESPTPDGLTELRVVSDGKTVAAYRVNLKRRHEPAASDSGLIRQWESYRLGGFVCYNDNQFVGTEYSTNKDAKTYNPSKLDVAGWAAVMKSAGMKYAVLTTRHTSGFLLWDSATTRFDVASSGDPTDVAGEFVKQCRRQGIAPGFYYCLWGGKSWMPNSNARAIILAQLHELASRYGEIPYFWIDMGNWRPSNLSPQEIYDSIRNQQPNAIVILNQHIQDGSSIRYFPTDVINGEVHLPPVGGHQPFRKANGKRYYLPFEFEPVSQRIAKGTTTPWGPIGAWFTIRDSQPLPARDLFEWIRQAYERGANNVLISLAPDHTGNMRGEDVRQLEELGKLLREAGLLVVPPPASPPPQSLALDKPARSSGVWEDNVKQYGPAAAFDGDPSTRWGGPVGSKAGWLEVDLGQNATVSRAVIQEGWDRTRRFSVQYKPGDEWKDAAAGTTIGIKRQLEFTPVKARVFRLNITDSTDVPTIWEFQLFPPPPAPRQSPAAAPRANPKSNFLSVRHGPSGHPPSMKIQELTVFRAISAPSIFEAVKGKQGETTRERSDNGGSGPAGGSVCRRETDTHDPGHGYRAPTELQLSGNPPVPVETSTPSPDGMGIRRHRRSMGI